MSKSKYYVSEKTVEVLGQKILATRVNNDVNGNPRWVVHFSDLGLELNHYQDMLHVFGFKKYRANWFGGGVVFQSYNIEDTLEFAITKVNSELKRRRKGGLQ